MVAALRDLELLAIDCQASGATPAYGDLLELGWAVCGHDGLRGPIHEHFVVPRSERRVPARIRELTGWSEACVADALPEQSAWSALRADVARVAAQNHDADLDRASGEQDAQPLRALAVIHFARFELTFLRDLHARLEGGEFPLDAICLHAIATRLFPDLPRRNIRALSGYLGHSTGLLRRCGGHVEASAFIWRALLPRLEALGLHTQPDLSAWLAEPTPARPRARRVYPFDAARRRALPDRPGVYRFLRSNGDLLYVGKAASVRKRVASHFSTAQRAATERTLELLTQVQDVRVTETASVLEAALLESDEIKRLDPPYNVQLRGGERQAWFANRDRSAAATTPDAEHRVGPLPSRRALLGLHALNALADGAEPTPGLEACALSVPIGFLPERALFVEGWRAFVATHLARGEQTARVRVEAASRVLWFGQGRSEAEPSEDAAPDAWDLARVLRRLERSLIQTGLLVRRARFLCLLADADVAFRERSMQAARGLVLARGQIVEHHALARVDDLALLPERALPSRHERQACFDAITYDRLRVLTTELNRIQTEGGELALRFGRRNLQGERLIALMRWV
jgi:DNA polymerase-3 subunit epsilon